MEKDRVDEIFKIIGILHIELETDPTILGPKYIMERVATCRNHLNTVSQVRQDLGRERCELKRRLNAEETQFAVDRDNLLALNESVKRMPNVKDREAVVNTMLREQVQRIANLKAELSDIDLVEQSVKMVHKDLTDTAAEIRTQRSMIQADRVTGAGYGDESEMQAGRSPNLPEDDGVNEAELDKIMSEAAKSPSSVSDSDSEESSEESPIEEATPIKVGEPEITPDVTTVPSESEIKLEVPSQSKVPDLAVPGGTDDDSDIASFLAKEEPIAPKKASTPKKSKVSDPVPSDSEDDIDFSELLKDI